MSGKDDIYLRGIYTTIEYLLGKEGEPERKLGNCIESLARL